MFSFKCTRKLIKRLGAPVATQPLEATTHLGDWYGNVFFVKHHRLMMFVSDRSLLPMFMPLRERDKLLPNFRSRLSTLLLQLGVEERNVLEEMAEMEEAVVTKTASPSVLGSMNDFGQSAKIFFNRYEGFSLLYLELWLAETPCGPLNYRSPNQVAPELLAGVREL
jgi:hypothetical protein